MSGKIFKKILKNKTVVSVDDVNVMIHFFKCALTEAMQAFGKGKEP